MKGEIVHSQKHGVLVIAWCDLCWQRHIVRWYREARRRAPHLFAPKESA